MTLTATNTPPESSARKFRLPTTVVAWLGLVGYLVLAKVMLALLPPIDVAVIAGEFTWSAIAIVAAMGLVGALLAEPTGFMPALDPRVTNRQRFVIPALGGVILGVLAVLIDIITHGTKFIESQLGESSFNVSFPASVAVYTAGAVSVEAIYRLLPFPVIFGLIGYVILRRRWEQRAFVVVAVILSLFEGLTQGLGILLMKPSENVWFPSSRSSFHPSRPTTR